jgi:hypothetical protein
MKKQAYGSIRKKNVTTGHRITIVVNSSPAQFRFQEQSSGQNPLHLAEFVIVCTF